MPNRGIMVMHERRDFEQKFVYNTVKRALNIEASKKGEKLRVDKALKHVAHQVHSLMQDHERETTDAAVVLDTLSDLKLHLQLPGVPATLGRQLAREIYEEIVGSTAVLEPNLDYVDHGDRPGMPAPVNLNITSPGTSSRCWAEGTDDAQEDSAEGRDDEVTEGSEDNDKDNEGADEFGSESGITALSLAAEKSSVFAAVTSIFLLEYARSPKEFVNALMLGPELAECRDELARHGFSCTINGGAKAFVRPDQYKSVVEAVARKSLKPRHIIVAEEFEGSLKEALKDTGKGIKTRTKTTLPPIPMVVKRTFLEVPVPSSLRSEPSSDPVTSSTTDANPRVHFVPRKA